MRIEETIFAVLLPILCFVNSNAQTQKCGCKSAPTNQMTVWGTQNIILMEPDILKSIRGKVIAGGKPLSGVLVEVYNNPEGLLMDWKKREEMKSKQQKIAVCVTDIKGGFCFPKLFAGRYEVRFSKADDWDSTSIYVIVDPASSRSKSKKLIVRMQVSQ